jgi:hypothetical protein
MGSRIERGKVKPHVPGQIVQPSRELEYLIEVKQYSYLCRPSLVWYKRSDSHSFPRMRLAEYFGMRRRQNWSAVVVLVAVCSLTVSLATRYSSPGDGSVCSVKACARQTSPEAGRQRLAKDAAHWIAPVISSTVLRAPSSGTLITSAAPKISNFLLAEALYNRPPPSA